MKILKCLIAAVALLSAPACSGAKTNNMDANKTNGAEAAAQVTEKGKVLVVFFSHAGDNYGVGNVKEGNTKIVADYIHDFTGADVFEIKTAKYDGMAYAPLTKLAKEEQEKGELPPFEGELKDIDTYDTVFIGGPVWWGTYPQVMFTFFKKYDLNGKTLIPFTTHEGSGLGRCVEDVKAAYPKATVLDGFEMYGHDVRSGKSKVEKWLKKLGF